MIDVDPGAEDENVGHAVHALAPATPDYAPAGQFRHALALLPPVTVEYVPAGQFVQWTLYYPACTKQ